MNRNPALDILRGTLLLLMTMTHLPTVWSSALGQPLGFVSAAEGFVFLSAFLAGSIYVRQRERSGAPAANAWILRRAGQLYLLHIALLILAFTLVAWIAQTYERHAVQNLLGFYLQSPKQAILGGALLVYQPPLLDILPMYVLFLAATPLAMCAADRRGWSLVLGASVAVWCAAQFGLRLAVHGLVNAQLPFDLPISATGAFDLYAWQLLWVLGLWFGALGLNHRWREIMPGSTVLNTALAVSCALFVWRHYSGPMGFADPARYFFWIDKWTLSPVRLLNLAAIVGLLLVAAPWLSKWARMPVVEALGRSSQWVFVAHIASVLLILCLVENDDQPLAGMLAAASFAIGYCTLFFAAALHRRTQGAEQAP